MNITEFAMLKKMLGKGSGGGSNGLVDVDRISWQIEGDENCVYRLTAGLYYFGGGTSYTKQGKTYFVDKLPEVGEPFLDLPEWAIKAVYYNTSDKVFYAYITDEIATAEGMTAGWNKVETLVPGGRTVTNCKSMTASDMYYVLLNTVYFIYKEGTWRELGVLGEVAVIEPITVLVQDQDYCGPYELTYKNSKGVNVTETVPVGETITIEAAQGTNVAISGGFSNAAIYLGENIVARYDFNRNVIQLPVGEPTCDLYIFG